MKYHRSGCQALISIRVTPTPVCHFGFLKTIEDPDEHGYYNHRDRDTELNEVIYREHAR
jgi:hypothetical protein